MRDPIEIKSYRFEQPYRAHFEPGFLNNPDAVASLGEHLIIDARVADLYSAALQPLLARATTIAIDATEDAKGIDRVLPIVESLVTNKVRRGQTIVAIGGGIIQDITCFASTVLMRGIDWTYLPTTLLAQADSCIGSKSSINMGKYKNILGTFYPPRKIIIDPNFLETLDPVDICSGIGEILKVHAISGPHAFNDLAKEFDKLTTDRSILLKYIRSSLEIKKPYIERDEFDQTERNIFNYGHSFGHAIEAATQFAIPHGIAVTMGMAIANHVAASRGLVSCEHRDRMRPPLRCNYAAFASYPISVDLVRQALASDKKNTATELGLIFPCGPDAVIQRVYVQPDAIFDDQLTAAMASLSHE